MAAIVNVCVDPRLNHEVIRAQVESRLERMGLPTDRVFITSDVGGNLGSAARNTAELLVAGREEIVMAAVLHHDDCLAAGQGSRVALTTSAAGLNTMLAALKVSCPVLTGEIRTDGNTLVWSDEPLPRYEVLNFRMPRL